MSNLHDFGAVGDGQVDDTRAIEHAIEAGDGVLEFPRGTYRITRTLRVDLARHGRVAVLGSGGIAKLQMHGPGPALLLLGTHDQSADPRSVHPALWHGERMPTLDGLEIEGHHEQSDGVRLEGVLQPILTRLLIRQVRTAVQITGRARNVIVSQCHIYDNSGVGIHLDQVNLHQTIITGSHISYCRLGGIRIENSEIRNLQITGNDIEYNNHPAHEVPPAEAVHSAEIYVEVGQQGSVREGTISSNTIQATYSPGGANIRFIGSSEMGDHRTGMWAINGNLIGSQNVGIHLTSARGFAIDGNYIYSGHHRNVLVERSSNIVLGSNCIGHNPDYGAQELATGIRFVDCENCNITGLLIEDAEAGHHTVEGAVPIERDGLIELVRCRRVNVSGTQVLNPTPHGIFLEECSDTLISGCSILDGRQPPQMRAAVQWIGPGEGNMITCSRIGAGTQGDIVCPQHVHVSEIRRT
ncbi:MAG: right-handed parallel beta-helix repeat-containing protein [Pirellulaceae bacterium]